MTHRGVGSSRRARAGSKGPSRLSHARRPPDRGPGEAVSRRRCRRARRAPAGVSPPQPAGGPVPGRGNVAQTAAPYLRGDPARAHAVGPAVVPMASTRRTSSSTTGCMPRSARSSIAAARRRAASKRSRRSLAAPANSSAAASARASLVVPRADGDDLGRFLGCSGAAGLLPPPRREPLSPPCPRCWHEGQRRPARAPSGAPRAGLPAPLRPPPARAPP